MNRRSVGLVLSGLVVACGMAIALSPFLAAFGRQNFGVPGAGKSVLELTPDLSIAIFAGGFAVAAIGIASAVTRSVWLPVAGAAIAFGLLAAVGSTDVFFPSPVAERTYSLLTLRGEGTVVAMGACSLAVVAAFGLLVTRWPHAFRPVFRAPA